MRPSFREIVFFADESFPSAEILACFSASKATAIALFESVKVWF